MVCKQLLRLLKGSANGMQERNMVECMLIVLHRSTTPRAFCMMCTGSCLGGLGQQLKINCWMN